MGGGVIRVRWVLWFVVHLVNAVHVAHPQVGNHCGKSIVGDLGLGVTGRAANMVTTRDDKR